MASVAEKKRQFRAASERILIGVEETAGRISRGVEEIQKGAEETAERVSRGVKELEERTKKFVREFQGE